MTSGPESNQGAAIHKPACLHKSGVCVANASYYLDKGAFMALDQAVSETEECLASGSEEAGYACAGMPAGKCDHRARGKTPVDVSVVFKNVPCVPRLN